MKAAVIAATALAAVSSVAGASGVAAHSLEDLEKLLGERETYVELVEREAPGFTLQDAWGQEIRLSDYRGKVVVLWFIYAACTDVCPLQSQAIADIQEQVNTTPMRDLVQFVAITTDPERDTPEIMDGYGPAQGLDPANWVFLTSGPGRPQDATRQLARSYGLEFMLTDDGYQMHAVVTHLIDREGVLQARYHGLRFNPTNLILHLNAITHQHVNAEESGVDSFWHKARGLLPW